MNKKSYIVPTVRCVAMDAANEILVGSMWTGDGFTRQMEFEEEEDYNDNKNFWSF